MGLQVDGTLQEHSTAALLVHSCAARQFFGKVTDDFLWLIVRNFQFSCALFVEIGIVMRSLVFPFIKEMALPPTLTLLRELAYSEVVEWVSHL